MVHVLDFEFMSVDCMNFEEKENKFGNTGFYFKGFNYTPPKTVCLNASLIRWKYLPCIAEVTF